MLKRFCLKTKKKRRKFLASYNFERNYRKKIVNYKSLSNLHAIYSIRNFLRFYFYFPSKISLFVFIFYF